MRAIRQDEDLGPLVAEIRQEQAASLGRAGRELAAALDALREDGGVAAGRAERVRTAARRLWYLVIQREACGLTSHAEVFEHYRVPADVRVRMGGG